MPAAEELVELTVTLPRSVVDQIGVSAERDKHTIEEEFRSLIGLALALEGDPEELAAKADRDYAAYLAATGQRRPTTEELWEQMRRIRDEVADELYPE